MTEDRKLPPVTQIGMLSLALIVAGGIYLASHIPGDVPLGPPVVLLIASFVLLVVNVVAIRRTPGFARDRFLDIAKWALLAYAISAGLIEYTFIRNDVSGGTLVVLSLSLVVYALQVPILIGFTVARYA